MKNPTQVEPCAGCRNADACAIIAGRGAKRPCDWDAYDRAVAGAARAYRDADDALRRHTHERATWRAALDDATPAIDRAWRDERNRLVEAVAQARIALHKAALE